jgi:TctA family transporter
LTNFITNLALRFGPAEYFFFILLILLVLTLCSATSVLKGFGAVCAGILLAGVGTDVNSGVARFTFGWLELADGIDGLLVLVAFVLLPRAFVPHDARTWLARWLAKSLPDWIWRRVPFLWRSALLILAAMLVGEVGAMDEPVPTLMLLVGFTFCGVWFYRLDIPSVPLYFGFAYGAMLEENARRMLLLSRGDMVVVLQRPGVITFIALIWLAILCRYAWDKYFAKRVAVSSLVSPH